MNLTRRGTPERVSRRSIGAAPALWCAVAVAICGARLAVATVGMALPGDLECAMPMLAALGGLSIALLLLAATYGMRRRSALPWLGLPLLLLLVALLQATAGLPVPFAVPADTCLGGIVGPIALLLLVEALFLALRDERRSSQQAILLAACTFGLAAFSAGLSYLCRTWFVALDPRMVMSTPVAALVGSLSLALMHWQYRAGRQDLPWKWRIEGWLLRGFFALCIMAPVLCALLLLWVVRYSVPSSRFVELVHLCVQIIVSAAILCWSWSRIRVEMGAHSELMGALDTMPIALVSLRGEIQHWSRGCERLYQYSAVEARGRIKHQLLGIDVPGRWEGMVGRLRAGLSCEEEIFEQRRDGLPLVVLEQARIIHRTTDREPVIVLSMTDITARVRAEEALRASDARLALAVEAHGIGIFEWDAKCRALNLSSVAELLSDLAPGSFRGGLARWRRHLRSAFEVELIPAPGGAGGARVSSFDFRLRRQREDGRLCAIEGAARCVYAPDGRLIQLIGVLFDQSEREQRAAALRERESMLRSIVRTVPDAMISTDEAGIIRTFSATAEKLLGYRESQVIGHGIDRLVPDRHRAEVISLLGDQQGRSQSFALLHRDGTDIPVELAVGEAWIGRQRIFIGFFRDMTERLANQTRLAELREELIHVSRLHAMGEVAAGLAHELNQPLAATANFLGAAEVLLEQAADNRDQVREFVRLAGTQSLRAGEIMRRVRDFSSRGTGGLKVERLSDVVIDAVDLVVAGRAVSRAAICIDIDEAGPLVRVDRVQIQQVIVNLLRNALESLASGGDAAPKIRIQSRPTARSMVEIEVWDNGPGFSAEVLSRRYQPFFSTKKDGMGIGLSICRRIVEGHGGTLAIESLPGAGATMRFTVPGADAAEQEAA
jgi:two-component system sensor kinase FixL